MGHSQTSAQSLQSIAGADTGTYINIITITIKIIRFYLKFNILERKISFVLHEPDNESEGSSNTTVTMQGEENNNLVNSSMF